ncbi:CbtA family protein [Fodinicola acaciae]|uniref:CbtA family protein n=1 Tax=Fodinicola acaciae TaxID=2681555 RepID=UPI0031B5DD42
MRMLLIRGMLAGLAAGVLALVFGRIFGEPSVNSAISFESAMAAATGEHEEPELVSRAVQSTLGLATGVLVYALVFGGLFALAFAIAYGRIGRMSPRVTSVVIALVGFLVTFVVPFLKYPGNPPAVGNPDTIGQRTVTYFTMVVLSIALAVAAAYVGRRLVPRLGAWNATLVGAAVFVVAATIVAILLPAVDEVPPGFPAAVLWNFRLASIGTQLVMWTTIGLVFGALVQRPLTEGAVATAE